MWENMLDDLQFIASLLTTLGMLCKIACRLDKNSGRNSVLQKSAQNNKLKDPNQWIIKKNERTSQLTNKRTHERTAWGTDERTNERMNHWIIPIIQSLLYTLSSKDKKPGLDVYIDYINMWLKCWSNLWYLTCFRMSASWGRHTTVCVSVSGQARSLQVYRRSRTVW